MILLLGDIHGNVGTLKYAIEKANEAGAAALIQVGDFGLYMGGRNEVAFHRACQASAIPIYFIEGNHDDCQRWV